MGRKNAEMGKAHFSVLKMEKVRRLLKVSFFFHANFRRAIIRMMFFLVGWLRIFLYSLPDTFKTLSDTIVEHFRVFFFERIIYSQISEGTSIEKL